MAIAHEKPKYTIKDYMALPEGERVELIGGQLLMSPSPRYGHQKISGKIFYLLTQWVGERDLGEVLAAPMDVVLSEHDVVQPDILFISSKRKERITEENIRGAPDLIVEILSPGSEERDAVRKKALYQKHGVREYWIVDPVAETISVFVQEKGEYLLHHARKTGILESRILTGFKVSLMDIFPPKSP